jgi:ubiquinone/menaquinone biosynthesis C-methylase UbiE
MRRPRFIAEQARNAKGPIGRVIAWIMARETQRDNLLAIEALDLRATDHVLDIGTGHGWALARIASQTPNGTVTGLDPSSLMVEIAKRRSATLVRDGKITIEQAHVAHLPLPDAGVDKAMSVHTLYFWPDLGASLKEIARVLRPQGRLVLVFRSSDDARAVAAFPAEVYRFPAAADVISTLKDAGFSVSEPRLDQTPPPGRILMIATRRA